MTELATIGPSTGALALRADQHQWTGEQSAALAQLGLADAPPGDLAVFMHVAQRTGLDPFSRQIYMIGRPERQRDGNYKTKWTIQTGIDGFRIIADRRPEYAGQVGPEWCGDDGKWRDFWAGQQPPVAARVGVLRRGWDQPTYGVAMFIEYAQTKSSGGLTAMWQNKGALMLAKCAESLALRKAFPHDLAGLVTPEEMDRDDDPRGPAPAQLRPAAPEAVPVDELTGGVVAPQQATSDRMRPDQQKQLLALVRGAELEDRWGWISETLGREVRSYGQLTGVDADNLIEKLNTVDVEPEPAP